MSIKVDFWLFSKRQNSTKIPNEPPTSFDGVVRDNCDITSPTIKFKLDSAPTYNYCRIPAFGNRYYTVRSWRWLNGLWECDMLVDALASWKKEISDISTYIVRSSSAYDGNITDALFPSKPEWKHLNSEGSQPFLSGPNYILQYAGRTGTNCVLISQSSLNTLCVNLWRTLYNVAGMGDLLANFVDPFQYVLSIQATPAGEKFWTGIGSTEIVLGTLSTGVNGTILSGEAAAQYAVPLPKHPQAKDRPFLKGAPYSDYVLKLPGIGMVNLNADDVYNDNSVNIVYEAEPYSGSLRASIYGKGGLLAMANGKITSQWGIGSNSIGLTSGTLGILGSIASAITGDFIGAGLGIANSAASMTPSFSHTGSNSGAVGMYEPIECVLRYREVTQDDVAEKGRPLMTTRRIGDLQGFVQCMDGEHGIACTSTERETIAAHLTGGFFFE